VYQKTAKPRHHHVASAALRPHRITFVTVTNPRLLAETCLLGQGYYLQIVGDSVMFARIVALISTALLCSVAWGQASSPAPANASGSQQSLSGMDMSGHDMSNMGSDKGGEATAHMMHSMEGHMDMGPHMKMTALRQPKPGDATRAQQVADAARKVAEKYEDYRGALADGFKIFFPNVPQKVYHFTSRRYAIEAELRFNPEHPIRCSMKSMATTTSSSGSRTPRPNATRKISLTSASHSASRSGTSM